MQQDIVQTTNKTSSNMKPRSQTVPITNVIPPPVTTKQSVPTTQNSM